MTTRRNPSLHWPDSDIPSPRSLPWLSLGAAVSAVSLCGVVFASASMQPGAGWPQSGGGAPLAQAFGVDPASAGMMQPAKMLSGIGAQTFAHGARPVALAKPEMRDMAPNIAPVAWDRLSAGDCMTVTVKSGQAFSFRILGARPADKPAQPDNLPKIELAVSACADMGEAVAKAVIQPTNPPSPKAANVERTL
jgi:hypothetical protein